MTLKPFIQLVTGESPSRAFDIGTHAAKLAFGNGGFTGTLADKGDFVLIRCPKHYEPRAYAESLIDSADERIAEMARLLSGTDSENARAHAQEMLESASRGRGALG